MDAFLKDLNTPPACPPDASFTIAAIAALALGIAANTAIFSVVNTVLLKPFVYRGPDRIVMFQNTFQQGVRRAPPRPRSSIGGGGKHRRSRMFPRTISTSRISQANPSRNSSLRRASAPNFFPLGGIKALQGRTFTLSRPAEGAEDRGPRLLVLAAELGGDPQAIGRRITLRGERYEIIGVVGANLKERPDLGTVLGIRRHRSQRAAGRLYSLPA